MALARGNRDYCTSRLYKVQMNHGEDSKVSHVSIELYSTQRRRSSEIQL
jgi:hypothetical protein